MLYRDIHDGGLGLMNVSIRALALLIRTFLETSINPSFRHSLFHEHLFRYHVMGEHSLPDPGYTPYYDRNFFNVIMNYRTSSTMNIATMTMKEWYSILLEDKVLKSPASMETPSKLLPVRSESLHPTQTGVKYGSYQEPRVLGQS